MPCRPEPVREREHLEALTRYRRIDALRLNSTTRCGGDHRILSIWIDPDESAAKLRAEALSISRERDMLIVGVRGVVTLVFKHWGVGEQRPHPSDAKARALGRGLERAVDRVLLGDA